MLKECQQLQQSMSWRQAMHYFEGDVRCTAVPDKEREALYEDYLYHMQQQQKDQQREERREKFRALKIKFESDSRINSNCHWRDVKEWFKDDSTFLALDKIDRLSVFEDHMKSIEKSEEDKKRIEFREKKKSSRLTREKFRVITIYSNFLFLFKTGIFETKI
jgi:hypothetical protein